MKRILGTAAATLVLVFAASVIAQQSVMARGQSEPDPRMRQLRNEVAQLEETLRAGRVDRQEDIQEWQERYEQKLDELRERQQFEGRYLSNE